MKILKRTILWALPAIVMASAATAVVVSTNKSEPNITNQLNASKVIGVPYASAPTITKAKINAVDIGLGDYTIDGIAEKAGDSKNDFFQKIIFDHKSKIFVSGFDKIDNINKIRMSGSGKLDDSINVYFQLEAGAWYDESGQLVTNRTSPEFNINIKNLRIPTKTNATVAANVLGLNTYTVSGVGKMALSSNQILKQAFLDHKQDIFATSYDKFTDVNQIRFNGSSKINKTTSKVHFSLNAGTYIDKFGLATKSDAFSIEITGLLEDYDITRPINTLGGFDYDEAAAGNIYVKDLNLNLDEAFDTINENFIFQNKSKFFTGNLSKLENSGQITIKKKQKANDSIKYVINLAQGAWYEAAGLGEKSKDFTININGFEKPAPTPDGDNGSSGSDSDTSSENNSSNLGLGLGLGLGIPAAIIIIVVLVIIFRRRKSVGYGRW